MLVSFAIILPEIDTVSSTNTVESNMMIRTLADCLRNRLLAAIFKTNPVLDNGLSLLPLVNPKYRTGESAFIADNFALSSIGLVPNKRMSAKKWQRSVPQPKNPELFGKLED